MNIIDNIKVWYDDLIITKNIIVNSFQKSGIINTYYTTNDEDKIMELYSYDLFYLTYNEIIDDLSDELKVDSQLLVNMNNSSSDEELDLAFKDDEEINDGKKTKVIKELIQI